MQKFFLSSVISICIPVIAFAQAGILDSTFDDDGMAIIDDSTGFGNIYGIGMQSDGKIVIGGRMTTETQYNNWVFYRFTSDGKLDSTFGINGKANVDFNGTEDFGYSLAIQHDDKIVACGITKVGNYYNGAIARLTPDGELDNSFSDDGKIILGGMGDLDRVALDPDGNILVVGRSVGISTTSFLIQRYLPDGTLDNTFNATNYQLNNNDWSNDLAMLPNGEILIAGISYNTNADQQFVVLKYQHDGTIDSTFGANGAAYANFDQFTEEDEPYIAVDPDGRIVVSGYGMGNFNNDIVLARFTSDGIPDTDFSDDGKLTTDVFGSVDRGRGVIVQPDGKILVTGYGSESVYSSGVVLIRYNVDGSLDAAFADNGIAYHSFDDYSGGWDLMFQPDGKILVCAYGYLNLGYVTEVGVLRFLNDIALGVNDFPIALTGSLDIYPNPLINSGVIKFSLEEKQNITIDLFDLQGRKIENIIEGNFPNGSHELDFHPENVSDGVYFVRLKSENRIITEKVIVQ